MAKSKKPARPTANRSATASRMLNAFSIGALAVAAGAVLYQGVRRLARSDDSGHAAPDLALDAPRPGSDGRAPVDFRPDPTAPVPAAERDALRPAVAAS